MSSSSYSCLHSLLYLFLFRFHQLTRITKSDALSCELAYQCSHMDPDSSIDAIDCSGHSSCRNAERLIVNDYSLHNQMISCDGSYSCFNVPIIAAGGTITTQDISNLNEHIPSDAIIPAIHSGNVDRNKIKKKKNYVGIIYCDGYFACSKSNLFSTKYIWCHGSHSCLNSVISPSYIENTQQNNSDNSEMATAMASNVTLYCSGDYGCADSVISRISEINGGGSYGLYKSKIYSNGQSLEITLNGYNTGNNLHIYCDNNNGDSDVNCKLNCFGNGCNETYLHCDNENGLCEYDCNEGEMCPYICDNNNVCSLGQRTNNKNNNKTNKNTNNNNNNNNKNSRLATFFWDEPEVTYHNNNDKENDWALVSNEKDYCLDDSSDDYEYDNDNSNLVSLLCDNFGSKNEECYDHTDTYLILSQSNNNDYYLNLEKTKDFYDVSICCRGSFSCMNDKSHVHQVTDHTPIPMPVTSKINSDHNDDNSEYDNNNDNNEYLTELKPPKTKTILCYGTNSCESQNYIFDSYTNGKIICAARDACFNMWVQHNSNAGLLGSSSSSSSSSVSKTGGSVECNGELSCIDGRFEYINELYCNGYDACFFTIIKGVKNIYVRAHEGMHSASIYSSGNDDSSGNNNNNLPAVAAAESLRTLGKTNNNNNNINNNNNGNEMSVYLDTYDGAHNTSIFCNNVNDICNIHCNTYHSCFDIKLFCDLGTCNIYYNSEFNSMNGYGCNTSDRKYTNENEMVKEKNGMKLHMKTMMYYSGNVEFIDTSNNNNNKPQSISTIGHSSKSSHHAHYYEPNERPPAAVPASLENRMRDDGVDTNNDDGNNGGWILVLLFLGICIFACIRVYMYCLCNDNCPIDESNHNNNNVATWNFFEEKKNVSRKPEIIGENKGHFMVLDVL